MKIVDNRVFLWFFVFLSLACLVFFPSAFPAFFLLEIVRAICADRNAVVSEKLVRGGARPVVPAALVDVRLLDRVDGVIQAVREAESAQALSAVARKDRRRAVRGVCGAQRVVFVVDADSDLIDRRLRSAESLGRFARILIRVCKRRQIRDEATTIGKNCGLLLIQGVELAGNLHKRVPRNEWIISRRDIGLNEASASRSVVDAAISARVGERRIDCDRCFRCNWSILQTARALGHFFVVSLVCYSV